MLSEAEKEEIRWYCKTAAGGGPGWEERAELCIAEAEKTRKPEPVPAPAVEPAPHKKPTHHKK